MTEEVHGEVAALLNNPEIRKYESDSHAETDGVPLQQKNNNDNNMKRYLLFIIGTVLALTAGTLTLTVNKDADGNSLFSIAGAGLATTTADGTQTSTTGAFSIKYASLKE